MTDQERADAVALGIVGDREPTASRRAVAAHLAEVFDAIRLDERRAIVAWLVKEYGASCRATGGIFTGEAFLSAIEVIERGEAGS